MGNSFEVFVWVLTGEDENGPLGEYKLSYSGENFEEAMFAMLQEKRNGAGCVKFYHRG